MSYSDIGGCDQQKQEIREAVELPLTHFDLYKQIGIDPPRGVCLSLCLSVCLPVCVCVCICVCVCACVRVSVSMCASSSLTRPKGVLLYGPPGTGKTMITRAVAAQTKANFIRVNGSEFVQKYLGEGPRMVRDVFRLARDNAPAIIFIDEVDAIATKRFDAQTGADREVQRILLELLTQMDGFDQSVNVKVIMATNRHDTLDPALLRPGRLDRKVKPAASPPPPPPSPRIRSNSPSPTAGKSASSSACAPQR